MKRVIAFALALSGIGLFVFVVSRAGPDRIWNTLRRVSLSEILILVLLRLVFWSLRALNWKGVLERCGGKSGLLHLLGARMAGHAVGYITPTSRIGGDAFKALMVKNNPQRNVIASVVIDKTIELAVTALLIPVGLAMLILSAPHPPAQTGAFLFATTLLVILVLWLIHQQRKGFFMRVLDLLNRFRLGRAFRERHQDKIAETDALMSDFYRSHRDRFFLVFLGYLLFMALWTFEIFLNLKFLGSMEITPEKAFLLVILGSVAFVLPGVPGSVGVYEMTYLSLFVLLGLGPSHAVSLILVRRGLDLLMAAWGMGVILLRGRSAWSRLFPGKQRVQFDRR
ncbi:MAG: flippase-like domain-containing protein [Candidatus Aminicenantes bacterium]|nr:flippase-like domain-containing protein [Candidatus Aminicenantes bacterium]